MSPVGQTGWYRYVCGRFPRNNAPAKEAETDSAAEADWEAVAAAAASRRDIVIRLTNLGKET